MTILVISHAHPDYSVGGAEIAAYNLFRAARSLRPKDKVIFLARTATDSIGPGSIVQRGCDEYLWRQDIGNWFFLKTAYPVSMFRTFRNFLQEHRPNVIFAHHYVHLGVEMCQEIKKTLPEAKLIMTLHEYVAICNRNGQMVKSGTNRLCYRESIEDCHMCFPDISEEDFWLRKNYIRKHFAHVDHFISPSKFLMDRYVAWGIAPENISVIENGQPSEEKRKTVSFRSNDNRQRIGFFGQITEYKGLNIFLEAISQISPELREGAVFEIHGANLEQQGDWLKNLIAELRAPLEEEGCLRWAGPYSREEALRRISKVDWVVVPSIWWENSPMIIQEAFVCRKPVICSDIGGMAEKVLDGVNGLQFEVANPFDLAEKLIYVLENPELATALAANIKQPLSYAEAAEAYLALERARRDPVKPESEPSGIKIVHEPKRALRPGNTNFKSL